MKKLKPTLPSPAMVVALIALVMASTGTAVAVTVANSQRVDGISAVPAGASLNRAAGKLVATNSGGAHKGQIQPKYLDLSGTIQGRGLAQVFGANIEVVNQNTTIAQALIVIPFFGTLTVQCIDENTSATLENPRSVVNFSNTSGSTLALARTGSFSSSGNRFTDLPAGATDSFTISSAHTYEYNLQSPRGVNVLINGVVNQLGANTTAARCNEWGQAVRVG